jgi:hypothetical protein
MADSERNSFPALFFSSCSRLQVDSQHLAGSAMTTPATSTSPAFISDKDVKLKPAPNPSKSSNEQSTIKRVDELEEDEEKDPDQKDILRGMKLFLAFAAMMLSLFLVALDAVGYGLFLYFVRDTYLRAPIL